MRKILSVLAVCALIWISYGHTSYAVEEGAWPGVDSTVVGKYAEEHGRPASEPIINLEGDALLFAFLAAGVGGGFVIGYYYRDFTESGRTGTDCGHKKDKTANAG